jgi:hypothetical protein
VLAKQGDSIVEGGRVHTAHASMTTCLLAIFIFPPFYISINMAILTDIALVGPAWY